MFARPAAYVNGIIQKGKPGYGWLVNPRRFVSGSDVNANMSVDSIMGGVYYRLGMTAGRTDTVPTAAAILAAMPDMNIGDSFMFMVSNQTAQILTLASSSGVTVGGATTVAANSFRFFQLMRNDATTFGCTGL